MSLYRTIPAPRVRSLTWEGDALVDWARGGTRYELDGTITAPKWHLGYRFDACIATPDGEWAVVYERCGTKALLLRHGKIVRELDRSYYMADVYEYPIALWRGPGGRLLLAHCPKRFDRLEIDDAETGERLTRSYKRSSPDVFHSRLQPSPDGRRLLSAGWMWHPWDVVHVFDVKVALEDPSHLDELTPLDAGEESAHESSACWQSRRRLLVGVGAQSGDPNAPKVRGQRSQNVAVHDVVEARMVSDVQLRLPAGRMMPVGGDHVLCLHHHPRLISLTSGTVVRAWPEVQTGRQISSVVRGVPVHPIALDPERGRIAVARDDTITVLDTSTALH